MLAKYVRALILLSLITFVVWSAVFFVAGVPSPSGWPQSGVLSVPVLAALRIVWRRVRDSRKRRGLQLGRATG